MQATTQHANSAARILMLVLLAEKVIQHVAVTVGFAINWHDIRSTVAVSPDALMVSGAFVALAFAVALWALWTRRAWVTGLVVALALFDIIGEFIAQGSIWFTLNVSFIVATALLLLALFSRREPARVGALYRR